jgi:hypothetical protein
MDGEDGKRYAVVPVQSNIEHFQCMSSAHRGAATLGCCIPPVTS